MHSFICPNTVSLGLPVWLSVFILWSLSSDAVAVFKLPKTLLFLLTASLALLSDFHPHRRNSMRASQGDAAGEKEKLQFEMKWPIMRISITTAGIYASAIEDCSWRVVRKYDFPKTKIGLIFSKKTQNKLSYTLILTTTTKKNYRFWGTSQTFF